MNLITPYVRYFPDGGGRRGSSLCRHAIAARPAGQAGPGCIRGQECAPISAVQQS